MYFNSMWSVRTDPGTVLRQSKNIYVGETRIATKSNHKNENNVGYEHVNTFWYHSDHLGSAQLVTNSDGNEHERLEYTPYGELWVEKTSNGVDKLPFRFTGKEFDEETGLYYYGARYLDPMVSRWLSTDPALGEYIPGAPVNEEAKKANGNLPGMGGVFNTVNLALYHYAGNNPVKYIDPNGMWTFSIGLTGTAFEGLGPKGGFGISIGYSKEQGLGVGAYAYGGMNAGLPAVAGVGIELSYNHTAKSPHDLDGPSSAIGGSLALGGGVTVEVATDGNTGKPKPENGVSLTVGIKGAPIVEGHASVVVTQTAAVTREDCIKAAFSIKQAYESFVKENIVRPILEGAPK